MHVWGGLVEALEPNHKQVYTQYKRGDTASLIAYLMQMQKDVNPMAMSQAVKDMANLSKSKDQPFSKFLAHVNEIKGALDTIKDPDFKIGPSWLTTFVLSAIDADNDYENTVAFLRKVQGGASLDLVIIELSRRAQVVEGKGMGKHGSLRGMSADLPPAPAERMKKSTGICWKWRDTGACRFGDHCKFSHDGQGGAGTGNCYVCGSTTHGVDASGQCPDAQRQRKGLETVQKKRAETERQLKKLQARLATTNAELTDRKHNSGGDQATGVSGGANAFSHGGVNAALADVERGLGVQDAELATLFAGRPSVHG
jgi:hypothetical protein